MAKKARRVESAGLASALAGVSYKVRGETLLATNTSAPLRSVRFPVSILRNGWSRTG